MNYSLHSLVAAAENGREERCIPGRRLISLTRIPPLIDEQL